MNMSLKASEKNVDPRCTLLGALALAFYALHGSYHILNHHPENLLWSCHLASVCIGAGWLIGSPTWNAIGFLWLCIGVPLWLFDVATGGEFIFTSLFTHVGGFVLGIHGLRILGMPRGAWWKAVLFFVGLQQLCRWITPPEENLNLAFAIRVGSRKYFDFYFIIMSSLLGASAVTFWGLERILRRRILPQGEGSP